MFQEYCFFVLVGFKVISHFTLFIEDIVEQFAVQIDISVKERIASQSEMHDTVIRFRIRVVTTAATDKETAVLVLIVLIGLVAALMIGHQFYIIIRIVVRNAFYVHPVIFRAQKFHAAVFVSGREDQTAVVCVTNLIFKNSPRLKP